VKTYEIKHLETGKVLQTVEADGFTVDGENGVVVFYTNGEFTSSKSNVAITQVSASTLIDEKRAPKPALVVPFPEAQCTKQ
jgi:hypothetical protein